MPGKKTKLWRFTKKRMNTASSMQEKLTGSGSPSCVIYRSITELPLCRWIDLDVDGYLKALVKEGDTSQEELLAVQQDLRIQYADAIGDGEYKVYINLMREIGELNFTLVQVEELINVSRETYHPLFGKELNRLLKSSIIFPGSDREKINAALDRAWRRSRGIKVQMDLKNLQFKKLEKKYTGSNKKPTREYYYGMLITLSDHAGYPISDSIMTYEYCERIRRANKENDLKRLKNVGRKN